MAASEPVTQAIAGELRAAGVEWVFGLVGSTIAPLAEALADLPGVRVIPTRHEQAAAHMADAAARITRRPVVCYAHAAPGGLNLTMGVATAWRDSVPLIFINGDVEREQLGREAWQATDDLTAVMRPITKAAWRLERPEDAAERVRRAVVIAAGGRPGPVYLQIPRDVLKGEGEPAQALGGTPAGPLPWHRPVPPAEWVAAVAERLRRARRPVLAVGGGVVWSDAAAPLAAVAERSGAPVVVSQTSRGVLDETGPWCLGASGHLGNPAASRALAEADVVVAVGNRLSDLQWDHGKLWRGQELIHVDVDAGELGRYYPARLSACADAGAFLQALAAALPAVAPAGVAAWREALCRMRDAWYAEQLAGDGHFGPADVTAAVWETLPPDAIVTIGAGRHAQYGCRIPHRRLPGLVKAIGSAAMGHAFPAALAAKAVRPDRPAVALVGDGDFLMNVQELETAVREKLPAVAVIYNDFRLASQGGRGFRVGVHHGNPDFAALAQSFGAAGLVVHSRAECRAALEQALAGDRPALIDARIREADGGER